MATRELSMSHPAPEQLQAFLTDAGDQETASHLEVCADCRRRLDQLAGESEPDWSLLQRPEPVSSTAALQTLQAIARSELVSLPRRWSGTPVSQGPVLAEDHLPDLPGYELLMMLERGGMGRVYKARQIELNRIVAIKMLDSEPGDSDRAARFRTEAEAIAQLQHPSIVQIFEIGQQNGRPYFSMEFASCGTLAGQLAGMPQDPRVAADILSRLAEAVQCAHEAGIIHRDIKPGNVLLFEKPGSSPGGQPQARRNSSPVTDNAAPDQPARKAESRSLSSLVPKLADFGLAKRLGDIRQTRSGTALGTPGYVAPEQALGSEEAGPAADLFGLGAVLYEMLTGRPPYLAACWEDLLAVLHREDVVPPRLLQPTVPPELELICLKCLRRDPRHRYATARALGEDLRRFLAGERIQARPPAVWRRIARWCRRHPAASVLMALTAFLLAGGSGATIWLWQRALTQRDMERQRAATSLSQLALARDSEQLARQEQRASEARFHAQLYQRLLQNVDLQLQLGQRVTARNTLLDAPEPQRNAAWYDLFRQVHPQLFIFQAASPATPWVYAAAFSADGRYLATASGLPLGANASPDSRGTVQVRDLRTGEVFLNLDGRVGSVTCLAFRSDGQRLVTGEISINGDWIGTLRQWDVATGQELPPIGDRRSYIQIGFSPDGRYLAARFPSVDSLLSGVVTARTGPGELTVFDADTGEQKLVRAAQWNFTFSADGRTLQTVDADGTLTHTDIESGRATTGPRINPTAFVSPDGRRACYFEDQWLRIHSTATGLLERKLPRQSSAITCLAFSPDGQLLAAPGADHRIRIWHLASGEQRAELTGHAASILSLTFNDDSTQLVSTGADSSARVWTLAPR